MPVKGSFQKAATIAKLQQNMWDPANKVKLPKRKKTIFISPQDTFPLDE
jgi:hypothetical protein